MNKNEKRQYSLYVDEETHDKFKRICFIKQKSFNSEVAELLKTYVRRNKPLLDKYDEVFGEHAEK